MTPLYPVAFPCAFAVSTTDQRDHQPLPEFVDARQGSGFWWSRDKLRECRLTLLIFLASFTSFHIFFINTISSRESELSMVFRRLVWRATAPAAFFLFRVFCVVHSSLARYLGEQRIVLNSLSRWWGGISPAAFFLYHVHQLLHSSLAFTRMPANGMPPT